MQSRLLWLKYSSFLLAFLIIFCLLAPVRAMAADYPTHPLDSPLSALRGVGAERVAQLARLKLHTTGDLLLHRQTLEDEIHAGDLAQERRIEHDQPGDGAEDEQR